MRRNDFSSLSGRRSCHIGEMKDPSRLQLSPQLTAYVSASARSRTPAGQFCKEIPLLFENCSILSTQQP
jgi:hypothetical protein